MRRGSLTWGTVSGLGQTLNRAVWGLSQGGREGVVTILNLTRGA